MRMDTNGNERVHRRFNPSPDNEELGEINEARKPLKSRVWEFEGVKKFTPVRPIYAPIFKIA